MFHQKDCRKSSKVYVIKHPHPQDLQRRENQNFIPLLSSTPNYLLSCYDNHIGVDTTTLQSSSHVCER